MPHGKITVASAIRQALSGEMQNQKHSIMKTTARLLILFFLLSFTLSSQTPYIDLTFTSSFQGLHVPLDSILVSNVSKNSDTMLYGSDTVIRLEYETGIGEKIYRSGNDLALYQNYPNPFNGVTEVEIYIPSSGEFSIMLSGVSGRVLHKADLGLHNGLHKFKVECPETGIYFLNVLHDGDFRVIRMISNSNGGIPSGKFSVKYLGKILEGDEELKDYGRKFPFEPGDIMQFTGFAGRDQDMIQDNPLESRSYEFVFENGGFPCPGMETVDYEGQEYGTIQISDQCWFRENLNVGEFLSSAFTMTNNEIIEKYCYLDLPENCDTYGGLYEWNEMMDYVVEPGVQGICPPGWHVPTDDDWQELIEFLGGDRDAGGLMKEIGTEHWDSPNTGATNASGFTALGAGQYQGGGVFTDLNKVTIFWSSTTSGLLFSNYWLLQYNSTSVNTDSYVRTRGFSVRCLREEQ